MKNKLLKFFTIASIGIFLSQYVYLLQKGYEHYLEEKSHEQLRAVFFVLILVGSSFLIDVLKNLAKLPSASFVKFQRNFWFSVFAFVGYIVLGVITKQLVGQWAGLQTILVPLPALFAVLCCYLVVRYMVRAIEASTETAI